MRWLDELIGWLRNTWEKQVQPWVKREPKMAALVASGAVVVGILWIGGSILVNGLIAGLLISAAVGVLLYKFKESGDRSLVSVYNLAVRHPVGTDVVLSLLAFVISPSGITGWVASGIAALVASVWLVGAKEAPLPPELAAPAEVAVVGASNP